MSANICRYSIGLFIAFEVMNMSREKKPCSSALNVKWTLIESLGGILVFSSLSNLNTYNPK